LCRTLFAGLFAREVALLNAETEDWEAWEAVYSEIESMGLRLLRPEGSAVLEVLLHIDGATAWFRWSGEPLGTT
jgi:hypothetical protein